MVSLAGHGQVGGKGSPWALPEAHGPAHSPGHLLQDTACPTTVAVFVSAPSCLCLSLSLSSSSWFFFSL